MLNQRLPIEMAQNTMNNLDRCQQLNNDLKGPEWPTFNRLNLDHNIAELEFNVDPKLAYFEGHFPQQAVLPGVVQVHWVGKLSAELFAAQGFFSMQKVKFVNMVLPGSELRLSMQVNPSKQTVAFVYTECCGQEIKIISSGELKFNHLTRGAEE